MREVCVLGLFLALLHLSSSSLLLGAFNIKSFGKTKASNKHVMDIISTIVNRYDIILIQEVRDSDLSATKTLMDCVNKISHFTYNYVVSEPLGDSTYKEQYLFLYRDGVCDAVMYVGTGFKRPPFVVGFSSTHTALKSFVLIPQHTSPDNAVKEVDALYDVAVTVQTNFKTSNIVLLGDFNAGCNYVKTSDWQYIRLFTDKTLHWLITDYVDTTVSESKCPYDRIVVTSDMMKVVVAGSAGVYNFRQIWSLGKSQALDVSDHFPVEVELG